MALLSAEEVDLEFSTFIMKKNHPLSCCCFFAWPARLPFNPFHFPMTEHWLGAAFKLDSLLSALSALQAELAEPSNRAIGSDCPQKKSAAVNPFTAPSIGSVPITLVGNVFWQ